MAAGRWWGSRSQLGGAHAVPDADQRLGHLVALLVDQGREVPRVVEPAGCRHGKEIVSAPMSVCLPDGIEHTVISHDALVQHPRLPLVPHVGDPDGPDADAALRAALVQLIPQRLVQLLFRGHGQ